MRIFSGIQPTGEKHLGNLIGGFRQYAATQEQGVAFFCIVDLHSITTDYDPADLHARTLDLYAMLIATGLDPERSTVFAQSHVTAHAEAAWLLSAVTSYGQLGRMTQFKEKADRKDFVSAGLFTYPVLMAGDILLYQADIVPIGDDQRQHLELARDVAERFNTRFGDTFTVPAGRLPRGRGPDHGPAGADAEDVDDRRHAAGHDRAARPSRRGAQEVPLGGDRLGPRGAARRRQAGRLEPDRHPLGRIGPGAGGDRGAATETAATASSSRTSARRSSSCSRRCRSGTPSSAADEGELLRLLALGADKARAASTPDARADVRGDGLRAAVRRIGAHHRGDLRARRRWRASSTTPTRRRSRSSCSRGSRSAASRGRSGSRPSRSGAKFGPAVTGRAPVDARQPAGALHRASSRSAPASSSWRSSRSSARCSRTRCSCSGSRSPSGRARPGTA